MYNILLSEGHSAIYKMWLRKIYYALSPNLRRMVRRIYYFPIDAFDKITGKRPALVPPKGKIFIGPGNFVKIGNTFLQHFINQCELKPDSKILDVGCGIGRIARPLSAYLTPKGSYDGFDIVEEGINWCKHAYRSFDNFKFIHIPLRNDLYNLTSTIKASEFVFPYPDEQFDLVILTSVFTHMQEDEIKQYFREISRVLKCGKYCFCTFFLITPESEQLLNSSPDPFFKYRFANYFLHDEKVKDANIAFRYELVLEFIKTNKLSIQQFNPGWWSGRSRETSLDFQDIIVLKKQDN